MASKRKSESAPAGEPLGKKPAAKKAKTPAKVAESTIFKLSDNGPVTIQIVAGSYDRVLHGVTATLKTRSTPPATKSKSKDAAAQTATATFADTFLFNAHNSAIRCLALSPPSVPTPGQSQKVLLATGSTDERINIYNLSAHPPSARAATDQQLLSSLAPRPILENPKNRELGTLLHHSSNITRLVFPNRSKLLSASEDSTVAVTRARDWQLLHTFKCPIPKVFGRPSGDTAALGGQPSGVNDFAVHPSNKIMISVSKGERCMRLWNLETGKKSRVLNFGREVLGECGEGRHSTGEARRIVWGSVDGAQDEFAVGFERDVLVYGMDCLPKCRIMGEVKTKIHEMRYVDTDEEESLFAVSTEDGRVLFFSTAEGDLDAPAEGKTLPTAKLVAQLGGTEGGVSGRIKDFTVLPVEDEAGKRSFFIVTAGSDGQIRVWQLGAGELSAAGKTARQVGKLLGSYGTQNRITCVTAFIMIPRAVGAEESEYEFDDESEDDAEDSDDE
ncbi:WD40 repeat-like protein [Trichocladium antarcticum]|uniref:WD40 repeat-like protein n=1 Tax=Trichocladium antarcticum TaxID=1450529 RepID=A0AAN6ZHX0_9PEZI|nr:WD40 repeat-like protein [Trichocladium antarcticum]